MTTTDSDNSCSIGVPLLDLSGQYRTIAEEVKLAIEGVVTTQCFILGPKVEALEDQIAQYCQCDYGVGVSSGSDALLVALMALGVGVGDEVITTPYTFFATGGAVARLGARLQFCDIDPSTYNLSPQSVQSFIDHQCEYRHGRLINRITGGCVKVLLPVHLYGQMAEMDLLMAIARAYGLGVVEDAAQAIGAENAHGQRAGSVGDIGCFSFFPSKNLGGFGDGGMCTTNSAALAERLKVLRSHGSHPKYYHAMIGGNFRLDALQAAVLSVKLCYLDDWTDRRQAHAAIYCQAFSGMDDHRVLTPTVTEGYRHIYNQFVLRVQDRNKLKEMLVQQRIGSEIYYPVPLHLQRCFTDLGYREGDLPESERAARETIAIPVYPELREDQQQHVINTIKLFYS